MAQNARKSDQLTVRITPQQREALEAMASDIMRQEGRAVSLADMVRILIDRASPTTGQKKTEPKSARARARSLGLDKITKS